MICFYTRTPCLSYGSGKSQTYSVLFICIIPFENRNRNLSQVSEDTRRLDCVSVAQSGKCLFFFSQKALHVTAMHKYIIRLCLIFTRTPVFYNLLKFYILRLSVEVYSPQASALILHILYTISIQGFMFYTTSNFKAICGEVLLAFHLKIMCRSHGV